MGCVYARDWDVFRMAFEKKNIPNVLQDKKASESIQLVQGQTTVSEYEAKFAELSRYAPHIIGIKREKAGGVGVLYRKQDHPTNDH